MDGACRNKVTQVLETIQRGGANGKLMLNYCSGVNIPANAISETAHHVNTNVITRFPASVGTYGVMIMDFYPVELVWKLILANATTRDMRWRSRLEI